MAKIIGIDLGTTNSCVAVVEAGKPKVIPSSEGRNIIPSAVEPVKGLVGDLAKRQMVLNPEGTIYSVKRLMGRRFSNEQIKETARSTGYKIVAGKNDMAAVEVAGKTYTPQEISAKILQKIKKDAESFLGEKVTEAVITVPAYFDDSQRQATKQAGEIAGFKVKRIINEPTAAALAYGLDKKKNQTIAVYDLGGGTFDISVLEIGDGVFEVKATNGDTFLGGDDFDQKIINWLIEEFKKENGIDLGADVQAMQRIKEAAEKAKIELSSAQETEINLPFITQKGSQPVHLKSKLSRSFLEKLTDDLVARTMKPVADCLKDAKVKPDEINEVIMVGGQTRMPKIQAEVEKFFGKKPNKSVNPDEVVAMGAAIQGAVLAGDVRDVLLLDVTPLSLGIETMGGVMTPLIERNTTVPTKKSQIFSTAADNQTQVEVHALQGERSMAADNKSLGRFVLDGIPPAPRGVPQIEVSFDIDTDGILKVSAKDKATGKEQKITIKNATNLDEKEVEKMKQEAEKYAREDEEKKARAEAKNKLDAAVFSAEKLLKDGGGKIGKDDKGKLEEAVKKAEKVLADQATDKEGLESETASLTELVQTIGTKINQSPPQANKGDGSPGAAGQASAGKEAKDSGKKTGEENKKDNAEEGEIVEE